MNALQRNSAARCNSLTSCTVSQKTPGAIDCICLASCCMRGAFLPLHQAGFSPSRRFRMSAAMSQGSPKHITRLPSRLSAPVRDIIRPVAVMLGIYRAVLHEMLARGWRDLDEPVGMPSWRKLALVLRHGLTGR